MTDKKIEQASKEVSPRLAAYVEVCTRETKPNELFLVFDSDSMSNDFWDWLEYKGGWQCFRAALLRELPQEGEEECGSCEHITIEPGCSYGTCLKGHGRRKRTDNCHKDYSPCQPATVEEKPEKTTKELTDEILEIEHELRAMQSEPTPAVEPAKPVKYDLLRKPETRQTAADPPKPPTVEPKKITYIECSGCGNWDDVKGCRSQSCNYHPKSTAESKHITPKPETFLRSTMNKCTKCMGHRDRIDSCDHCGGSGKEPKGEAETEAMKFVKRMRGRSRARARVVKDEYADNNITLILIACRHIESLEADKEDLQSDLSKIDAHITLSGQGCATCEHDCKKGYADCEEWECLSVQAYVNRLEAQLAVATKHADELAEEGVNTEAAYKVEIAELKERLNQCKSQQ